MKSNTKSILFSLIFTGGLVAAMICGKMSYREPAYTIPVRDLMGKSFEEDDLKLRMVDPEIPKLYEVFRAGEKVRVAYVCVGEGYGYEGPILTAVAVHPEGFEIIGTAIIQHKEWPSWIAKIEQTDLLGRLKGKKITDYFALGRDVDGVSGATISTRGIVRGIRESAHFLAVRQFGFKPRELGFFAHIGLKEFLVFMIFFAGLYAAFKKKTRWRRPILFSSGIVLGFWLTAPLTLGKIGSLLMGRFPPLAENIIWYIIVVGVTAATLIGGKNFYCYWLCPFGAVQEALSFSGINLNRPGKRIAKLGRVLGIVAMWTGLVIIFLSGTPSLGSFEPFSTMFGFKGGGFRWLLLVFFLLAGILLTRFWCRFFCPVGALLRLLAKTKRLFRAPKKEPDGAGKKNMKWHFTLKDAVFLLLFSLGASLIVLVWLEGAG